MRKWSRALLPVMFGMLAAVAAQAAELVEEMAAVVQQVAGSFAQRFDLLGRRRRGAAAQQLAVQRAAVFMLYKLRLKLRPHFF